MDLFHAMPRTYVQHYRKIYCGRISFAAQPFTWALIVERSETSVRLVQVGRLASQQSKSLKKQTTQNT